MSVSRNETEGLRHSEELRNAERCAEIEQLYQSLSSVLVSIVSAAYRLHEADVISLLDETLYAYLVLSVPVAEAEAWVITEVHARAQALSGMPAADAPVPAFRAAAARSRRLLATLQGLELLAPHARRAVQLRIRDGLSYEAVALELEITVDYAKRLVARSMTKLRDIQRRRREEP